MAAQFAVQAVLATESTGRDSPILPPQKKIALTFDAGASGAYGDQILKTLRSRHLTATFFLTGKFAKANPDLIRSIVADGHELANHTMNHIDLRRVSSRRIVQELEWTEDIVRGISKATTKPYFRPPFGARNARVLKAAASAGYTCVHWTCGGQDANQHWIGIKGETIRRLVVTKAKPGGVVLLHLGSKNTANILPKILDDLISKGFALVPVSELDGKLPQ